MTNSNIKSEFIKLYELGKLESNERRGYFSFSGSIKDFLYLEIDRLKNEIERLNNMIIRIFRR